MKTDFNNFLLEIPKESWKDQPLAFFGGPTVIPKEGRGTTFPNITKEDILQMMISLQKQPEEVVNEFTEKYRKYVGAEYAIATSSGTSSLQLALIGAGVKEGDEVIVPAFTFIATAQAVVAAKAIPIFVDIDPQTFCMDTKNLENKITRKTKVIMPVHVHGLPANVKEIKRICEKYNLALVEDASHAHSALYNGQMCGSLGDCAGQSLMADKNFPVGGEGGISFFKSKESYDRAKKYLEETGIDYDMSWIVAAFGISQLERLPYYDKIRQRNARALINALEKTSLFEGPFIPEISKHSFNMFRIKINMNLPEFDGIPNYLIKEAVQQIIMEEGVFAREWQNVPIPQHLPFKNKIGFGKGYPFNLYEGDLNYGLEEFPNILEMLNTTLVICREMRSPVEYEKLLSYKTVFEKLDRNIDQIVNLAKTIIIEPPYERDARLG